MAEPHSAIINILDNYTFVNYFIAEYVRKEILFVKKA